MEQIKENDTPFSSTEKYLLYRIQQLESKKESLVDKIKKYDIQNEVINSVENLLLDCKDKITTSIIHIKKLQQMEESCSCENSCAVRFGIKSITDTTNKELQIVIDNIDEYFKSLDISKLNINNLSKDSLFKSSNLVNSLDEVNYIEDNIDSNS